MQFKAAILELFNRIKYTEKEDQAVALLFEYEELPGYVVKLTFTKKT